MPAELAVALVPGVRPVALPNPAAPGRTIRAVIFDVDGTLYTQSPVRTAMAIELALFAMAHPSHAVATVRVLRAYRRAQETLRRRGDLPVGVETQAAETSAATGMPPREIERIAAEWMCERPLKYLAGSRAEGLLELLEFLRGAGATLGVVSDYAASDKLRALGVDSFFDVVLCATDPDVGAFKPSPKGLLRVCAHWALAPGEVLYIGDRVDVDCAAAAAAGMPCVIITPRPVPVRPGLVTFSSFTRLHRVLDNDRH